MSRRSSSVGARALSASCSSKKRCGSNEAVSAVDEPRGAEFAEVGGERSRTRTEAGRGGEVIALDAATGKPLWDFQSGGAVRTNPMSFAVDGKQRVVSTGGSTLFVFGLD